MNRSILVTGASGFVGKRLCRSLTERGHRVLAVVRSPAAAARLPPGVEVVFVDDIGPATVWPSELLEQVDVVVHLAARVHVLRDRALDPAAEFYRVNVAGSEALARVAAGKVRRFVHISSLHAVRVLSDEVLDEQSPCRPDTPYGKSKFDAEVRLQAVAQLTGMELVVVRPAPVYGPENLGNLSKLFRLVHRGWPIPLGRISNRRSLVYVENLVDALVKAATHPAAANETYMVSDGEDVSVSQLVGTVAAALGRRALMIPAPQPLFRLAGKALGKSSEVERLLGSLAVDSGKIRRMLDWTPPYRLADGISETVRWMRSAA